MRHLYLVFLILFAGSAKAQVYNFAVNEKLFIRLMEKGITYCKTGNEKLDSVIVASLGNYWSITQYSVIEPFKRPDRFTIALHLTEKEWLNKHFVDRQNKHVLCLQPEEEYAPRKDVKMEQTLGYMYFNGFYGLMADEEEYHFAPYIIKALNDGITAIQQRRLLGEPKELSLKAAKAVVGNEPPSSGNLLIINREQTRHAIDVEMLDNMNIKYRLFSEEEFYKTVAQKNPKHVLLYYAKNRFTEIGLYRASDYEMLYFDHIRGDYPEMKKKDWKALSVFFK
jgi:hypothetical protein